MTCQCLRSRGHGHGKQSFEKFSLDASVAGTKKQAWGTSDGRAFSAMRTRSHGRGDLDSPLLRHSPQRDSNGPHFAQGPFPYDTVKRTLPGPSVPQ